MEQGAPVVILWALAWFYWQAVAMIIAVKS
jgi:hypothetical protein